jgi:hypothetical protein
VNALKKTEGTACQIGAPSLSFVDIGLVCGMTAPIAFLAGFVGWRFWESRNFSLISVFF